MLELEVFKLHFSLSEREELLVVVKALARVCGLARLRNVVLPHSRSILHGHIVKGGETELVAVQGMIQSGTNWDRLWHHRIVVVTGGDPRDDRLIVWHAMPVMLLQTTPILLLLVNDRLRLVLEHFFKTLVATFLACVNDCVSEQA